jgi:glutaredoxin
MMNAKLILYGTSACHLCHEALQVLIPVSEEFGVQVSEIDITSNENLERLYETRIPVVSLGQHELDWPFTMEEVRRSMLVQAAQKN